MIQMSNETLQPSSSLLQKRINQLNLLKWCFIGIIFIDIMLLLFFNISKIVIEKTLATNPLPSNMSAEELKEAAEFFAIAYWPVNIIGFLHIPLCAFSFLKFHQKKWHPLIIVNAVISLLMFPLGSFLGLVLFIFLYHSKGKELFQK